MTSHSDSEPDDDTITIAQKKVVINGVGGNCRATRTKQNNNKQNQNCNFADLRKNKHEKNTIAEFGD